MITANDIHNAARYTSIDGKWGKLTATQQKELFGAVVFGRKDVKYNREKQVWVVEFTTISRDRCSYNYSNARVAEMIANGEKAERDNGGKANN